MVQQQQIERPESGDRADRGSQAWETQTAELLQLRAELAMAQSKLKDAGKLSHHATSVSNPVLRLCCSCVIVVMLLLSYSLQAAPVLAIDCFSFCLVQMSLMSCCLDAAHVLSVRCCSCPIIQMLCLSHTLDTTPVLAPR